MLNRMENKVPAKDAVAVLLGWKGSHRSVIAPAMHHRLCVIPSCVLSGVR